jgi:hypothetical protein
MVNPSNAAHPPMTDQQHKDQQPKMDFLKSNYNILSIALFVLAIVVSHIFQRIITTGQKIRLANWVHRVMTEN